jgi:hypothetical protein
MAKFLIEVPHEVEKSACMHAVQVFLATGSHFLANAEWGCLDGEHKAWVMIEAEDKSEARMALPPGFREDAKIVRLTQFTLDDVAEAQRQHQGLA